MAQEFTACKRQNWDLNSYPSESEVLILSVISIHNRHPFPAGWDGTGTADSEVRDGSGPDRQREASGFLFSSTAVAGLTGMKASCTVVSLFSYNLTFTPAGGLSCPPGTVPEATGLLLTRNSGVLPLKEAHTL